MVGLTVWGGQGLAFWYLEYEYELLTKQTRTSQCVTKQNSSLLIKTLDYCERFYNLMSQQLVSLSHH